MTERLEAVIERLRLLPDAEQEALAGVIEAVLADQDAQTALLSTTEAAAYLGVSRQAIHQLTRQGEVGTQIGRAWVFTRAELDTWRDKPRGVGRPPKARAKATKESL